MHRWSTRTDGKIVVCDVRQVREYDAKRGTIADVKSLRAGAGEWELFAKLLSVSGYCTQKIW